MRKRTIKSPPKPRPKTIPINGVMNCLDFIPKITHQDLQQNIADLAKLKGWRIQFWWRSFHSAPGFLDIIMGRIKDHRLVVIEVKIPPDKLSPAQQEWYDFWKQMPFAEVYVITPKEWLDGTIEKILE